MKITLCHFSKKVIMFSPAGVKLFEVGGREVLSQVSMKSEGKKFNENFRGQFILYSLRESGWISSTSLTKRRKPSQSCTAYPFNIVSMKRRSPSKFSLFPEY